MARQPHKDREENHRLLHGGTRIRQVHVIRPFKVTHLSSVFGFRDEVL